MFSSVSKRTISTLLMLFAIIFIIALGHSYILILIIIISIKVFHEIISLKKYEK